MCTKIDGTSLVSLFEHQKKILNPCFIKINEFIREYLTKIDVSDGSGQQANQASGSKPSNNKTVESKA